MVLTIDSDTAPVNIGDRIAVMNNGHIEQIGEFESVYQNPANQFVADFMMRVTFSESNI
jgi:ABC-type Fe3+/spermidine/putrescine transport system ATPase subunit